MSQTKTYICTGYPDEENIYHQHHTKIEEWECEAANEKEAFKKAREHFYYFHEILVSQNSKQAKKKR